jgi:hypothetical protein
MELLAPAAPACRRSRGGLVYFVSSGMRSVIQTPRFSICPIGARQPSLPAGDELVQSVENLCDERNS